MEKWHKGKKHNHQCKRCNSKSFCSNSECDIPKKHSYKLCGKICKLYFGGYKLAIAKDRSGVTFVTGYMRGHHSSYYSS